MYGMKRIDDDVFIFDTYHKEERNWEADMQKLVNNLASR